MIISANTASISAPSNFISNRSNENNNLSPKSDEIEAQANKSDASSLKFGKRDQSISFNNFKQLIRTQASEDNNPISKSAFDDELTEEEKKIVQELKKIDAKVRAHEAAHKSAGGPVAGAVSFQTVTGPDGREYAIAGEVQIDASPVPNNPEATIRKMELVIRAALAPADPSPQDRAVAAQAQQTKLQARQEAARIRAEEQKETSENNSLGLQERLENLQSEQDGVNNSSESTITSDSIGDSDTEIISILFGNSTI